MRKKARCLTSLSFRLRIKNPGLFPTQKAEALHMLSPVSPYLPHQGSYVTYGLTFIGTVFCFTSKQKERIGTFLLSSALYFEIQILI